MLILHLNIDNILRYVYSQNHLNVDGYWYRDLMVIKNKFHKPKFTRGGVKKAIVGPYRVKGLKIGRFWTVLQVILGLEEAQHRVLSNLTEISIADVG